MRTENTFNGVKENRNGILYFSFPLNTSLTKEIVGSEQKKWVKKSQLGY